MDSIALPSKSGRWTDLKPFTNEHHEFLYQLGMDRPDLFRWKYRISMPSFEVFSRDIDAGISAGFTISDRKLGAPLGAVIAHSANFQSGYAYLSSASLPSLEGSGSIAESFILFIQHMFTTWSFRKLYYYVPEYSLESVKGARNDLFEEEGCLRNTLHYRGRDWNQHVLAVYRAHFFEFLTDRRSVQRLNR